MLSQVSFTIDTATKRQALEKAKSDGITLKAVLTHALKGFVDGRISLGFYTPEHERDVEELSFTNKTLNENARKIAELLG